MTASFNFNQTYGSSPGTAVDLGDTGNLVNFKDIDDANASNYSSYPITASNSPNQGRSYEIFLRAHYTGTFATVSNIKFWMSQNFNPADGLTVYWKGNNQTAYATPVKTDSALASAIVPSSNPGTANVSIGGSLAGVLSSAGYSDYIVIQLDASMSAKVGDTSLCVFSIEWDES